MMQKIKLMADYQCFPLWWQETDKVGDIDPATLPLSQETIERLKKWAAIYDRTLNLEDPILSGFASEEETQMFDLEGISLWHQLRKELAPDYEVSYFSDRLGHSLQL